MSVFPFSVDNTKNEINNSVTSKKKSLDFLFLDFSCAVVRYICVYFVYAYADFFGPSVYRFMSNTKKEDAGNMRCRS